MRYDWRMRAGPALACATLTVLALVAMQATLLEQSFETGLEGWTALGSGAKLRVTHEAGQVKSGQGALAVDYMVAPQQVSSVALPAAGITLDKMKSIRFWLKTTAATPMAALLSERKPGGDYVARFWSPKDTWQQVELSPSDFVISDGPNAPKDPDGHLDLDQVQGVGLFDLAQYLNVLAEKTVLPFFIDTARGRRSFFVDDFQVLSEAPPSAAAPGTVVIDDFHQDFLRWITLGRVDLSVSRSGNPLERPAMVASYERSPGRFPVVIRQLGGLDLTAADRLSVEIASDIDAHVLFSLEEKTSAGGNGPRYNMTISVPGKRRLLHKTLPFADFMLDSNGPEDSAGAVDPARLKTLSLVDLLPVDQGETEKNTLWIGNLQALIGKAIMK